MEPKKNFRGGKSSFNLLSILKAKKIDYNRSNGVIEPLLL